MSRIFSEILMVFLLVQVIQFPVIVVQSVISGVNAMAVGFILGAMFMIFQRRTSIPQYVVMDIWFVGALAILSQLFCVVFFLI